MIIVIIAGGSGTRLWPLSQGDHPKHLLALPGEPSLLQNTYHRTRQLGNEVYVVTEQSHSELVAKQLPQLAPHQLIVEPFRRGTASCFALALARISERHKDDESVAFLHSDHHIPDEDSFGLAVKAAAAGASASRSLALVGIKPTYPATGFGYIECGEKVGEQFGLPVRKVKSFREKPPIKTAEKYVASGNYLWNQGLFAADLSVWKSEFKTHAPYYFDAYEKLANSSLENAEKLYHGLKSQAIDYALIEKTTNLVVVPGMYEWADIGSFFDLHKVLHGKDGNTLVGDVNMIECEDVMIHGTDKPIIAIGLSGIIVVDTPEGLLVCAKDKSQRVGELSKKLAARAAAEKTKLGINHD
jgi:mannose-1-phosphate guanylyltransferase